MKKDKENEKFDEVDFYLKTRAYGYTIGGGLLLAFLLFNFLSEKGVF